MAGYYVVAQSSPEASAVERFRSEAAIDIASGRQNCTGEERLDGAKGRAEGVVVTLAVNTPQLAHSS